MSLLCVSQSSCVCVCARARAARALARVSVRSRLYSSRPPGSQPPRHPRCLESLDGQHDTVTCIDVMIHYPSDKMVEMVSHLASKADRRLLISFAPKTPQYSFLTKVRARAARRARARGGVVPLARP